MVLVSDFSFEFKIYWYWTWILYIFHHNNVFLLQFQFVNSYLSLFYIGFYLKDMERLKEVRRLLALRRSDLPSLNALLSLHTCIDFHNRQPSHKSNCLSLEDVAVVVCNKESAAAGPGQCAAVHLGQDQDTYGLYSLVLQGFTQVQSMTPADPFYSLWTMNAIFSFVSFNIWIQSGCFYWCFVSVQLWWIASGTTLTPRT